ncbi:FAD-binding oxidoreductase [Anaerococcus sp. AGMB00486]|uniref:FAD-binding oxidoreductase n=2 Tax=Anaerococcus TaxID=165779 RepID=A0ABX2N9J4_9FIRM|nr:MULTISPECIES: FAD-binding oxidoreductase [Anaerococcus]MSS78264.1 FAD-binding oxidoreductase [Anaerococcus porci]NVF11377.1 FAD-binding oxidoreductase [Anaerococcus faecalis]
MDYNKINDNIIEKIKSAVKGAVYVGDEVNEDFFHDEMPIYGEGIPECLVDATCKEDVANIMKICNEEKIPVIARGAGTGLTGAGVAIKNGIMINMQSMNKILEFDEENMIVRVEPGVLLNDLAKACLDKGYLYPPDPGEKFATLGGNVSLNAGGMRAVKYGTTRDYVRKMEVVLPTGEITEFGSIVSKSSTGYSLKDLMVGSEGTLAIITELTLKIVPNPKYIVSLIVPFESLNNCISTVPKLFQNNLNPQAIEFMERDIIIASEKYIGKETFPKKLDSIDVGAYLLISFDGDDEDLIDNTLEQAAEILIKNGAIDVLVADTPNSIKDAWAARNSFLEAIESQYKLLDECDVVVPVTKIADYINFVNKESKSYIFDVKSFGHAGDGNLHIYTLSNEVDKIKQFKEEVDKFMSIIYEKAYEMGGKISGEHGIGFGKKKYLKNFEGDVNIRLMRAIKKAFDPNMILNPDKVIAISE